MSSINKPIASLSSSLLARKGQARPAMRPQGFVPHLSYTGEDLGWNDMGEDRGYPPQPMLAPAPVAPIAAPPVPEVVRQRAILEEQLAPEPAAIDEAVAAPEAGPSEPGDEAESPVAVPAQRQLLARMIRDAQVASRARTDKAKAAFTLRLDQDRHLRLRLASAVTNRSAQQLVTAALDVFLDSLAEVDALAGQLDTTTSH